MAEQQGFGGIGCGCGSNWIIWLLIIFLIFPYFGGGAYGWKK